MSIVVYDNNCNICVKIQYILKILDFFSLFKWVKSTDLYKDKNYLDAIPLIEESIVVITPKNDYITHFEACKYLIVRIPLLYFIIPFLYLPFLSNYIGNKLYKYVSQNRKCNEK